MGPDSNRNLGIKIAIIFVILAFGVYYYNDYKDLSVTEVIEKTIICDYPSQTESDNCVMNLALANQDFMICDDIQTKSIKENCQRYLIAEHSDDVNDCTMFDDPDRVLECALTITEGQNVYNDYTDCVDTDEGLNYYKKGSLQFNIVVNNLSIRVTRPDHCHIDENKLIEYMCTKNEYDNPYIYYMCENGCENGACIGEEKKEEVFTALIRFTKPFNTGTTNIKRNGSLKVVFFNNYGQVAKILPETDGGESEDCSNPTLKINGSSESLLVNPGETFLLEWNCGEQVDNWFSSKMSFRYVSAAGLTHNHIGEIALPII